VVALASYVSQPEWFVRPFEETVEDVEGLGRADVLVAGGCDAANAMGRIVRLHDHREDGFLGVRAIAASFHDRDVARRVVIDGSVDLGLVRYNAAHTGAREDVFERVGPERRGRVFGFKSTAGYVPQSLARKATNAAEGTWLPRITDHYRFALAPAAIDGLLTAPQTEDELDAMLEAIARGPLSPEEEHFVEDVTRRTIATL
jgi:hypothetical protein